MSWIKKASRFEKYVYMQKPSEKTRIGRIIGQSIDQMSKKFFEITKSKEYYKALTRHEARLIKKVNEEFRTWKEAPDRLRKLLKRGNFIEGALLWGHALLKHFEIEELYWKLLNSPELFNEIVFKFTGQNVKGLGYDLLAEWLDKIR